jgi:hypothetical protein
MKPLSEISASPPDRNGPTVATHPGRNGPGGEPSTTEAGDGHEQVSEIRLTSRRRLVVESGGWGQD